MSENRKVSGNGLTQSLFAESEDSILDSDRGPWTEVLVNDATYMQLEKIANRLDCTVSAALEEVIREFKP